METSSIAVIAFAVLGLALIINDSIKSSQSKKLEIEAIRAGLVQSMVEVPIIYDGEPDTVFQVIWTKPNA